MSMKARPIIGLILFCLGAGSFYFIGEKYGASKSIAGVQPGLWVDNIEHLKSYDPRGLAPDKQIFVQGFYKPGDGGGGYFFWSSEQNKAEDGGRIFRAVNSSGQWVRCSDEDLSVRWFGAVGDGMASDYAAFVKALAAATGHRLRIPAGTYVLDGDTLTIGPHTMMAGEGRVCSTLSHRSDKDMFNLAEDVTLTNLGFDGNGSRHHGGCFVVSGSSGRQSLHGIRAVSFEGPVLYFEHTAGSQFAAIDCQFARVNALTGSGRYAVVIDSARQLPAVPRKFALVETNGQCAFDFGGCSDVFISDSFLGDLNYSDESRGVLVSNSRVANQATLTMRGHNNTLVGCDLAPQVVLANGADNCVIGPNSYNRFPVVDQSGNGRNMIFTAEQEYLPVLANAGGDAHLGNGSLRGYYSRHGAVVFATIELIVGAETYMGTSAMRISLPVPATGGLVQYPGQAVLTHQGVQFTAVVQLAETKDYLTLIRDGTGVVGGRSPIDLGAGDIIRISLAYIR